MYEEGRALLYFSTLSDTRKDFREKERYWTQNVCFDFFYNFCLKHFSENSARYDTKMYIGLHVPYRLFMSNFNATWTFSTDSDPLCVCLVHCTGRHSIEWTHAQRIRICCHNNDLFHFTRHDRTILVVFEQVLYKAPWWWILCDPKHVSVLLNILSF